MWLEGLSLLLRLDRPGLRRRNERGVVALVQVGGGGGELRHGAVEDVALAEVGSDGEAVAGTRMRAGERPTARLRVKLEPPRQDRLEIDGGLPVPEMPDVEVALEAVEAALVADP